MRAVGEREGRLARVLLLYFDCRCSAIVLDDIPAIGPPVHSSPKQYLTRDDDGPRTHEPSFVPSTEHRTCGAHCTIAQVRYLPAASVPVLNGDTTSSRPRWRRSAALVASAATTGLSCCHGPATRPVTSRATSAPGKARLGQARRRSRARGLLEPGLGTQGMHETPRARCKHYRESSCCKSSLPRASSTSCSPVAV